MRIAFFASVLIPVFMLAACTPAGQTDSDGTSPAITDESPAGDSAAAGVAARQHLAARLNVDANDISVETVVPQDWSDSCLGLGGPAESCLAAITPGFAITLMYGDDLYAYRTNLDGTSVRAE